MKKILFDFGKYIGMFALGIGMAGMVTLSQNALADWRSPSCNPPDCGVDASKLISVEGGGNIVGDLKILGKLGVKTSSPKARLDISLGGDLILSDEAQNPGDLLFVQGGRELARIYGASERMVFSAYENPNQLVIDHATGRVGVGVAVPQSTLHIAGSLRINNGSEGAGKVLASDGEGNVFWRSTDMRVLFCPTYNPPSIVFSSLGLIYYTECSERGHLISL